jgi:hypothetical protein
MYFEFHARRWIVGQLQHVVLYLRQICNVHRGEYWNASLFTWRTATRGGTWNLTSQCRLVLIELVEVLAAHLCNPAHRAV